MTAPCDTSNTARDTRNRDLWALDGDQCPQIFGREARIPCEELHEVSRGRPPGRLTGTPRKPDNAVIDTPGDASLTHVLVVKTGDRRDACRNI